MLALSACSHDVAQPDPTASGLATGSATPTATAPAPSVTATPSLPAGVPTSDPSPLATAAGDASPAAAVITLATQDPDTGGLLVGGYVDGVVEDGGDCSFDVTASNGRAIDVHTEGVENSGSTSCGSTVIPAASVPSGTYTVVLRYSSHGGTAASAPVTVTMP